MSGGKTLEDLIKEHKDEDKDTQPPAGIQRVESEEAKKQRLDRVKAMESRLSNKAKIDDRAAQQQKSTTAYATSGGKNERVLEGRARALLDKKNQFEDSIIRKEEEEKNKQSLLRQEEEELKMHRTTSQKERAQQIVNRFGTGGQNQPGDSDGEFEQPDPFREFQQCINDVLYEEFKDLNKDNTIDLIEDEDDMEVESQPKEVDPEIVKFVFEDAGRCIKAHECILTSKLPLFRSMFSGSMQESKTHKIDVFDTAYEPYLAFIEFLYTGEIRNLNSSHLVDLLELSDRFCAEDLRSLIEDKLIENLDPGTLKDILEVAHHYKLSILKQECWRYAKNNRSEVSRYGIFKILEKEDIEQIKAIDT